MQKIVTLSDPSLFTDRYLVGGKWIAAEKGAAIEVANPPQARFLAAYPIVAARKRMRRSRLQRRIRSLEPPDRGGSSGSPRTLG
jgi:hypothetical protein